MDVNVALFVRLEAKPGKEEDVARFLRDGLQIVPAEPATVAWFAIRMGPSPFGIFDAFPDEPGRQAHLAGRVAAALMEQAPELFAQPPKIEKIDVLAAKLPGQPRIIKKSGPEERIPLQVGTELRIRNNGEISVDNPEVELATQPEAADAVVSYRFDPKAGLHILHLLDPVADHEHMRVHRRGD